LMDPEPIAVSMAEEIIRQDATEGEFLFSTNLREREFPWFESGEPVAESAAAVRCIPFALLHAGDFRRLKLDSCICATITHPHPSSIAGAALLSISIARLLHTLPGTLDPIPFGRSSAPFIAGIETDRSGGRNRTIPSLARKIGTELPALLLRRASVEEIAKSVGNGELPSEGIPFAFACVLSNPEDFGDSVRSAINSGNDAIRTGAMAGALSGALLGASAIPRCWLDRLDGRQALEDAADSLLRYASRPREGAHP
jgi:ADP-ribosylglycohydrolase